MNKLLMAGLTLCFALGACTEVEESTLITDDAGNVHHTPFFRNDKRGKNYFPLKIASTGNRHFIFDPKWSAWAAYDEDGNRVITGSGSGGKDFCEDINQPCRTITGSFHIYNKRGEDCRSGEYPVETQGGARMPYCMYFYRGFTIHAAYEVPHYPSSHGCIRVWPSAAKWLNEEFITIGTKVTVLSYKDDTSEPAA